MGSLLGGYAATIPKPPEDSLARRIWPVSPRRERIAAAIGSERAYGRGRRPFRHA